MNYFMRFCIIVTLLNFKLISAGTLGDQIRNECDHLNLSVLNGHYLLTGIRHFDDQLCEKVTQSVPLCDNVSMQNTRQEFLALIKRQIKTELKLLYGIDCGLTDFYSPPEESDPIDLTEAKTRIDSIIQTGLINGDPAFVVIAMERALFAQESPKTHMMNIIQQISGTPQVDADFNVLQNLLTLAMSGNTIAAQYAWQDNRIPAEWLKPLSQQSDQTKEAIKQLCDIGSKPFQYLFARSIFLDNQDIPEKMGILAAYDRYDACVDYWGVLYYINMILSTKPGTEATFSNDNAVQGWHTYFANVLHRPLSQCIAVLPLLKQDDKTLPRGYREALYAFAEKTESEPPHTVLRELIKKTKAVEVANCYILKYVNHFPETKTLSNDEKIAEIRSIAEIVPEAIDMLAFHINNVGPESLGFSEKTPEQRREALEDLANFGSRRAQIILSEANTGAMAGYPFDKERKYYGYKSVQDKNEEEQTLEDYMTIRQKRLANIYELAFKGSTTAQLLLIGSPTLPSLLQFHLKLNKSLANTPANDQQNDLNAEASNLLSHVFRIIKLLKQPHDITGGPINFLNEVENFVAGIEKDAIATAVQVQPKSETNNIPSNMVYNPNVCQCINFLTMCNLQFNKNACYCQCLTRCDGQVHLTLEAALACDKKNTHSRPFWDNLIN